jgi:hypothetical protein
MVGFLVAAVLGAVPAQAVSGQSTWLGGLPEAIPEASSLALLIVGLAAVGVAVRRRNARLAARGGEDGMGGNAGAPGPGNGP